MMKVSTKGRYGLRIMLELALQYGRSPVLAATIAANQNISANYIHLLIKDLRTSGLVMAMRGPNGGYSLAKAPSVINVLQVIEALEGKTGVADCVTTAQSCGRSEFCVAREVWMKVNKAVEVAMKEITLEQLVLMQANCNDALLDFQI
ncbi:MAG: Rrf2 family transcriptional regulator [Candidatus Riflebacteria bacterium]|nr:Rrf2 family transcriptional regulator [Candidatus Riflebacteria bacterium]